MYLTTTVSVALVLFLVGLECIVLLSAHNLITRVKENMALTVVLSDEADSTAITRFSTIMDNAPYCHHYTYITREQALREHIEQLGEDPSAFLGYNPLTDAFEVYLDADYAQPDSIAAIEASIESLPYVDDLIYQQDVVSVLDRGVNQVSLILAIVAIALLLMSLVLIVNTIRLHIYSKRFLINTMRLVGATPWVIRAPFIRRNVRMGFEAGILALIALAGAVYYCTVRMGILLFPLTWQNITFIAATVLIGGMLIAFLASVFATDRYVRMKIDKMYEI